MYKFKSFSFGIFAVALFSLFLLAGCGCEETKYCPPPFSSVACPGNDCDKCPTNQCRDGKSQVLCPDGYTYVCPEDRDTKCPKCEDNKSYWLTRNGCNCAERKTLDVCLCENGTILPDGRCKCRRVDIPIADGSPRVCCPIELGGGIAPGGNVKNCKSGCKDNEECPAGNVCCGNPDEPGECCEDGNQCSSNGECCYLHCPSGYCENGQCEPCDLEKCPDGCQDGKCKKKPQCDESCDDCLDGNVCVCKNGQVASKGFCCPKPFGNDDPADNYPDLGFQCPHGCIAGVNCNTVCCNGVCCGQGQVCNSSDNTCSTCEGTAVKVNNTVKCRCAGGKYTTTGKCCSDGSVPKSDGTCPDPGPKCDVNNCQSPAICCGNVCCTGLCEAGKCSQCPTTDCPGGCKEGKCLCKDGTERPKGGSCPKTVFCDDGKAAPLGKRSNCCDDGRAPYGTEADWKKTGLTPRKYGCCSNGAPSVGGPATQPGTCAVKDCTNDPNACHPANGSCYYGDCTR